MVQPSARSMSPASDPGLSAGAYRLITRPSRPMRNLLKFHLIASMPSRPPFSFFSHIHSGCAPSPLTSTLENMAKSTSSVSAQNSRDRQSVVTGKHVYIRVDLGGGRDSKKNKRTTTKK